MIIGRALKPGGLFTAAITLLVANAIMRPALADTGFWKGGDGDWQNTANWFTTNAGTTNVAAVPNAIANDAIFNITSQNATPSTVYLGTTGTTGNITLDDIFLDTTGTTVTTLLGGTSGSPGSVVLNVRNRIDFNGAGTPSLVIGSAAAPVILDYDAGSLDLFPDYLIPTGATLTLNGGITNSTSQIEKREGGTLVLNAASTGTGKWVRPSERERHTTCSCALMPASYKSGTPTRSAMPPSTSAT